MLQSRTERFRIPWRNAVQAQHTDREFDKLHAKIGQLTMENDFLSNGLGRDR